MALKLRELRISLSLTHARQKRFNRATALFDGRLL
jgi:hypothetical protein